MSNVELENHDDSQCPSDIGLNTPLWTHQAGAVVHSLAKDNLLLHLGMGSGKTLSTIAIMQYHEARRVLIMCPPAVLRVWQKQLRDHLTAQAYDNLNIAVCSRGSVAKKTEYARARIAMAEMNDQAAVIVVGYQSLWREPFAKFAKSKQWDLIIADECHRLKSPGSKQSRFASRLKATRKLGLSGTPITQGPLDAYGIYRFLDPNIFGWSYVRFRAKYAVMGGFENKQILSYQNQGDFSEKFNSIRYYVSPDDIDLDLPEFVDNTMSFQLPAASAIVYRELDKELCALIKNEDMTNEVTIKNALSKLVRLQQVTSGFIPCDDGSIEWLHNERREILLELIQDIAIDEPIVVFCRFRADLDNAAQAADASGRGYAELSGRADDLEKWMGSPGMVIGVQINAGAEGIDLTHARYAIFYSISFSNGQYLQARARVHRPGQTRTCIYYQIVAEQTIDEKIYTSIQNKRKVIDEILGRPIKEDLINEF